jgi:hypothetical protein
MDLDEQPPKNDNDRVIWTYSQRSDVDETFGKMMEEAVCELCSPRRVQL